MFHGFLSLIFCLLYFLYMHMWLCDVALLHNKIDYLDPTPVRMGIKCAFLKSRQNAPIATRFEWVSNWSQSSLNWVANLTIWAKAECPVCNEVWTGCKRSNLNRGRMPRSQSGSNWVVDARFDMLQMFQKERTTNFHPNFDSLDLSFLLRLSNFRWHLRFNLCNVSFLDDLLAS